jgi:hypothetical protein
MTFRHAFGTVGFVSAVCIAGCGDGTPVMAPPPPSVAIPLQPTTVDQFPGATRYVISIDGLTPPAGGEPWIVPVKSTHVVRVEIEASDARRLPMLVLELVRQSSKHGAVTYNACTPQDVSRTVTKLVAATELEFRGEPGEYFLGLPNGGLGYVGITPVRLVLSP